MYQISDLQDTLHISEEENNRKVQVIHPWRNNP